MSKKRLAWPAPSPETLWATDPKRRPIDAGTIGLAAVGAGAADFVFSTAKGFNPMHNIALEWRAEIAGALTTLKAAGVRGYERVNPRALQPYVALTLGKQKNGELLRMAGLSGDSDKDLSLGAAAMRAKVARLGSGYARAAWGARGLLLLGATKVMEAVHGTVGAIVGIIFPIAGVIGGAHIGISAAVSRNVAATMTKYVKQGMAKIGRQAQLTENGTAVEKISTPLPTPDDGFLGIPVWGWAIGIAAIGVGYAVTRTGRS